MPIIYLKRIESQKGGGDVEISRNGNLENTFESGESKMEISFAMGDHFSFNTIKNCEYEFSKYAQSCTDDGTCIGASTSSNPFSGSIVSNIGTLFIMYNDRNLDPISYIVCKSTSLVGVSPQMASPLELPTLTPSAEPSAPGNWTGLRPD